jgi:hypothetical protein
MGNAPRAGATRERQGGGYGKADSEEVQEFPAA